MKFIHQYKSFWISNKLSVWLDLIEFMQRWDKNLFVCCRKLLFYRQPLPIITSFWSFNAPLLNFPFRGKRMNDGRMFLCAYIFSVYPEFVHTVWLAIICVCVFASVWAMWLLCVRLQWASQFKRCDIPILFLLVDLNYECETSSVANFLFFKLLFCSVLYSLYGFRAVWYFSSSDFEKESILCYMREQKGNAHYICFCSYVTS